MSRAALLAAAAVALLVAGCVACAWIEGAPLVPADAGRADGGRLGVVFLALLVAAFAVYLGALALLRRSRPGLRAVLLAAVVIQVTPLAGPLLLSTDAWTYWEYGRIAAVHGGNPYVDTPSEFSTDPAYDYAGAAWRETTSVYGPDFTLLSELVALVSGSSAAAAAWIFKIIAAAAVLACAVLASRLARNRPAAAALVGWNPLFAIHFAGGGHNDALLAALVLGALFLATTGRRALAGAAWAARSCSSGSRSCSWCFAHSKRAPPAGASTTVGSRSLDSRSWGSRPGATASTGCGRSARSHETPKGQTSYALPHRVEQLGVPHAAALGLAAIALAGGLAWLAREALRGRARLGLSACLLLATTPWLAPWYTIWALPLAAAEDDRRAQLIALGFCAYLLPQTIPL